jgi:hypothetical protein
MQINNKEKWHEIPIKNYSWCMEYLYVSNVFVRALRLIIAYKFHPSACQICIDTE